MNEIWILDDDRSIRWVLEKALTREGLPWRSFERAQAVRDALAEATPAVLLCDVRMPGESGLELLAAIKREHPALPVIVMTAFSDLGTAVQALQGGAFEYVAKPFDIDELLALVRRAAQSVSAAAPTPNEPLSRRDLLGNAPAMQLLFRSIGRLAQTPVSVLITGETGTGKELVARALHEHSPRHAQPFIAINTAAIPKDLLESELFGHERGAFTGATTTRQGRFQQAEGGTLFLDEIGDMPPDLQVRLLRVLQDGEYFRVGGQTPLRANVRIIAATHQNLAERVRAGLFREDLLHRLDVVRLHLPPLRERREDIALLAAHFLARSARLLGSEPKELTPAALAALRAFDFPGNVRQLENLCHGISVMAPDRRIDVGDLPPEVRAAARPAPPTAPVATAATAASAPLPAAHRGIGHGPAADTAGAAWTRTLIDAFDAAMRNGESAPGARLTREFEIALIRTALAHTRGRRIEASHWLGWGRNTLTRKIHEYGLDDEV